MSFVGEQIRKYRNIRGMTQQDIADALGESSGRVIYNWEKGIGRPDCDKLARLCDLLGVSADELIGCRSMAGRPTATEWSTLMSCRIICSGIVHLTYNLISCYFSYIEFALIVKIDR